MNAEEVAKLLVLKSIELLDAVAEQFEAQVDKNDISKEDLHREWTYLVVFALDSGLAMRYIKDGPKGVTLRDACTGAWGDVFANRVAIDEEELNQRIGEYAAVVNQLGPFAHANVGNVAAAHVPGNSPRVALSSAILHNGILKLIMDVLPVK